MSGALGGRYRVERELGQGGMATVYLAEDLPHGRKVAVKVLKPEVAAAIGTERFLREIRIVARLSHPHILPLIDSGEADGRLYFVAPYVPDGSLRQRLGSGTSLPVGDAVRIAREVGAGLDYAHRQGFVHRDVKPENILFADGHAVLADFGVARACMTDTTGQGERARARPSDFVTEVGLIVGTPAYMSPEQASGEPDLDGRSDLYSLACVVYEMLAGQLPFSAPGARATMARQVTEAPKPVRALRPDAPGAVEQAVARALAKNRDDRFPSVAEFNTALEAETRDGRPFSIAATRHIAVLPFVNASPEADNEYLSDGITDELINALTKVEGLRVSSRTSVFALKGKPQDVRAIGALLGASWVLEGTVRRARDRLRITAQLSSADDGRLLWSERYDRTLDDVFAIQDEIARTIVDTLRATSFANLRQPAPRRYTENVKAYGLYLKGRYAWNKRTTEGVNEAIALFERAIAEDPRYALAYTGLADSYALHVDYRSVPVAEGFERAKTYARQALALDETLAEAHASLAWSAFIYDWDWESAQHEFRRAIELDPEYATAHQWYAFLLTARGNLDEAVIEAHTALELDPASVSVRRSVAWAYFYARRYDQTRYHVSRAIAMNPTAEESYRILGLAHAMGGRFDEAERVLRESLALPGAGAYAVGALGYVLGRAGRRREAEALRQQLEEERLRGYVSPVALALISLGLDDRDRTLTLAEEALRERRGWLAYLKVNPMLDSLRGEPRFRALVGRMNL